MHLTSDAKQNLDACQKLATTSRYRVAGPILVQLSSQLMNLLPSPMKWRLRWHLRLGQGTLREKIASRHLEKVPHNASLHTLPSVLNPHSEIRSWPRAVTIREELALLHL